MSWALIIDDDSDNRELLVELLESAGHAVESCGSAEEADRILHVKGPPSVVVSDVRLPDRSGPEFVAELRRRPAFAGTPAVFVTGARPQGASQLGDPVLVKPFDVDLLMQMVSRFCAPGSQLPVGPD